MTSNSISRKVPSHLYDRKYYLESDGSVFYQKGRVPPKIERALKLAQIKEGMTIVDIGCGRGDVILTALRGEVQLIGIDYSQEAMRMSSARLREVPEDRRRLINLILSEGTELPLKLQSVDVIFVMDLVEHLYPEQLQRCLRECRRVLKDRGRVVIHTSPNRWYNDFGYPLWERPLNRVLNCLFRQQLLDRIIRTETDRVVHVNEQTVATLRSELQSCGFKSKVWLGVEYLLPMKKENPFMQLLEVARQMVCHLFPFSLAYPLKAIFSNDIWAVAEK